MTLNTGLCQREAPIFTGMGLEHVGSAVRETRNAGVVFIIVSDQQVRGCPHGVAMRNDQQHIGVIDSVEYRLCGTVT